MLKLIARHSRYRAFRGRAAEKLKRLSIASYLRGEEQREAVFGKARDSMRARSMKAL
jgi:hypothetical protein